MKKLITGMLANLGYEVRKLPYGNKKGAALLESRLSVKLNLGLEFEDQAFEAMQVVKKNTMLTYEPLVSLYENVVYCERNQIPGAFVECGTWKGGATGMMAIANLQHGAQRRALHLFDSFEEICQADETHDDAAIVKETLELSKVKASGKEPLTALKGIYDEWGGPGALEINKALLENTIGYPADQLHYHKGWFQDTVPADAGSIGPIAILRLDGDWYESTKVCLEHLYPLVSPKGIVIIDDYGYNIGCRKAVHEYFDQQGIHPLLTYVNHTCRYFIKP